MAHTENTRQNRKNKHLSPFERGEIAALLMIMIQLSKVDEKTTASYNTLNLI